MNKKYTTMLIIVVSAIAIVGIAVGVSFAIWVNTESTPTSQDATNIATVNTSAKYLVFELYDVDGKFMYARYYSDVTKEGVRSGDFRYSEKDYLRYNNDGETSLANLKKVGLKARLIGFVDTYLIKDLKTTPGATDYTEIGYAVGEVETIEIPSEIPVNIDGAITSITVDQIDMQSPEEFKPLLNIKSVSIPTTVTDIKGVSFMGCKNLVHVDFNGHQPQCSEYAFVACGKPRETLAPFLAPQNS